MNRLTAIIIAFTLLVLLFIFANKWMEADGNLKRAHDNVKALKGKTEQFKNEKDQWQSKALSAEGNIKTLKLTHEQELEEIADQYEVKVRKLRNVITATTETNISSNVKPDSISRITGVNPDFPATNRIYFHDFNKWYRINGSASPEDVKINLEVYDSINYTTLLKRDGWFKPERLYIEATSYNPHTMVIGTQSINVRDNMPGRFGVGPAFNFGIGPDLKFTYMVGFGVHYSFIRF